MLIFGKPKTAIMSHIDNVGFMHTGTKGLMLNIGGVEYVDNASIRGFTRTNKKIETKLQIRNKRPFSKKGIFLLEQILLINLSGMKQIN